jgi:predicted transcriptional regulator
MKVREISELLGLRSSGGEAGLEKEINAGYCGDLLSDVIANSPQGAMWLTIQSHQNVVAVAVLKEMSAIVLVNGHRPDEETQSRADREGIPILLSSESAFQLAGKLYAHGIGREDG